jgi:hypothetical protein
MATLHLEFSGKSTRVSLFPLSAAAPRPEVISTTKLGVVKSITVQNGLRRDASLTAQAIIDGDPEIDLTLAGNSVERDQLSTAYFDASAASPAPIGDFNDLDLVYSASGEERERRQHKTRKANLDELHPIKLGKRMPVTEMLSQFVVRSCVQLAHVDGLTFEFLRDIARDLQQKGEVVALGSGPKGLGPLILRESGTAYRAFLFGEVDDHQSQAAQGAIDQNQRYKLLMLLSDQEFKLPEAKAQTSAQAQGDAE